MKCLTQRIATFILFGINIVIASGGIVSIAYGIKYLQNENGVTIFGDFSFGALSLTTGAIVLTTAVFGCLAACFTKAILLTIYSAILMLLFPFKLSLGIMGITKIQNYDFFVHEIRKLLRRLLQDDTTVFYTLQSNFQCCGVNDYTDYPENNYPASCCQNESPCVPFEDGCAATFAYAIDDYIEIISYIALIFTIIELIGAFIAVAVSKNRKQMSDIYYENFNESFY